MKTYSLIMAGGGGTRFWPLSRQGMPKQLLNLSGNDIMINETIKRSEEIIGAEDTFIVTNRDQADVLADILLSTVPRENILSEPAAKNTAPCILYSAMSILERRGDGVLCIFPSDHYITDKDAYMNILREGINEAEKEDSIITIGVSPTYPATGYGYIKIGEENSNGNARSVDRFVEKPNLEKAKEYFLDGSYFWNAGVFISRISVILRLFERFLPRIYRELDKIRDNFGVDGKVELLEKAYSRLENISMDYGIMERMDNSLVIAGDFGWSDVGSWDALGAIFPSNDNGNIVKAEHIGIDTKECIIYGDKKLIATVGLENIVVVDTEDALLICPKSRSQDVRKVVEELGRRGRTDLL